MGIDYDSNFGIGVYVDVPYDDVNGEDIDQEEWLDDLLNNTPYEYSTYGMFDEEYFFIYIKEPFEDGYDIRDKVKALEEFLNENKIDFDKIDVVGGHRVY